MADEFVDFYEVLTLPLDADRSTVRKRINELYVEAQRNLDHRNFATRIKFQEMFEITLPQARYILLDEGRRDDYDRMVRASRAPAGTAPEPNPAPKATEAQSTALGQGQTNAFKLSGDAGALPGEAPAIEALPPDPEAVAREREEMWKKWKSGLQSSMEREAAKDKDKEAKPAATHKPLADQVNSATPTPTPVAASAPATASASVAAPVAASAPATAPKPKVERPKVKFDFGGEPDNTPRRGEKAPVPGAEEIVNESTARLSPEEIEKRRTDHRRQLMKEELMDVGAKGMLIGSLSVLVPGVIIMVVFMSHFYPRGEAALLPVSSAIAWILWLLVLPGVAYLASYLLSKNLRRKSAMQMAAMTYEELLRHLRKDF